MRLLLACLDGQAVQFGLLLGQLFAVVGFVELGEVDPDSTFALPSNSPNTDEATAGPGLACSSSRALSAARIVRATVRSR